MSISLKTQQSLMSIIHKIKTHTLDIISNWSVVVQSETIASRAIFGSFYIEHVTKSNIMCDIHSKLDNCSHVATNWKKQTPFWESNKCLYIRKPYTCFCIIPTTFKCIEHDYDFCFKHESRLSFNMPSSEILCSIYCCPVY